MYVRTQSAILVLVLARARAECSLRSRTCMDAHAAQQYAAPPPPRLKGGFRATRKQLSYAPELTAYLKLTKLTP